MSKQLSDEQIAILKALADKPDENIDLSDIPEAADDAWKNAVPGEFFRPIKKQITVRIDADILAWLKSSGNGYQTRLNQVLREAMEKAGKRAV